MVEVSTERQGRILNELDSRFAKRVKRRKEGISAKEYAQAKDIHVSTAKNRLDQMVEDGLMYSEWSEVREGMGGNGETVYYLVEESTETKEIVK